MRFNRLFIGKFLRNGKAKITDGMKAQASALGYTMDEVLTVASIVEKEGANANEVAKIAAVIYNRLEEGMKLQMDSSIYYIERHVKPYLTGDINALVAEDVKMFLCDCHKCKHKISEELQVKSEE